jgi:hypothetical protein
MRPYAGSFADLPEFTKELNQLQKLIEKAAFFKAKSPVAGASRLPL